MPINELWLKDVGPIDEITFTFDPQVNVFIGPNNSGKSTVLAALAAIAVQSFNFPLALIHTNPSIFEVFYTDSSQERHGLGGGIDPRQLWDKSGFLLKVLEIRKALAYTCFIPAIRPNLNARVAGVSTQPLKTPPGVEDAIGSEFLAAVESVSNNIPFPNSPKVDPEKSPEQFRSEVLARNAIINKEASPVNDLTRDVRRRSFPLVPRMESTNDRDLLQLIVDLDYRSYRENRPGIRKAIERVFEVSSLITDGFPVSFLGIGEDKNGFFLNVHTPDGKLPFNTLSQGTQSMVQWLAHLILGYAMYYDFAEDFAEKPGVLIIDEIDAHLHPSWQRRILPTLTKHFPNLQIFCATHSPLLIAGLKAGQIQLLRRKEGGGITVSSNEEDVVGWSADEILSCYLDIANPTDMETDKNLKRLEELQLKRERTPEEEKEREELRSEVPKTLRNSPPSKHITELMESLESILQKREVEKDSSGKPTVKHRRKTA